MNEIIIAIIVAVGGILIGYAGKWLIDKIYNSEKKPAIITALHLVSFAYELFGDRFKEMIGEDLYKAVDEALDESIRVFNDPTLSDEAKEGLIIKYSAVS